MKKESNHLATILFLTGSLFAIGLYLAAPSVSWIFFLLAGLGGVKILNHFAHSLRMVAWFHSLVFESFAIAATFLMRPFAFVAGAKCEGEKGRPILMIHGYLQNGGNWAFLKWSLCRRGLGPIYTLNLTHPFRSIHDYAELVSQKAAAIAEETKRRDLILIGHSMGGLVSAAYAAKIAEPGRVSDVITIGSPMGGTKLAAMAIGPNGREMERGSDFVCQLQSEFVQNDKIRFYHIASKTDQIVLPYSSALTGLHPEREYLLDGIGHMSLLFSPRIADQIEKWLSSE